MSKRKDHIRKFTANNMLLARSNIGQFEHKGLVYQEAHIVCYCDGSGRITLRSRKPYQHITGYFYLGSGFNTSFERRGMLRIVDELVSTIKLGCTPRTFRRECPYSHDTAIEFNSNVDVLV